MLLIGQRRVGKTKSLGNSVDALIPRISFRSHGGGGLDRYMRCDRGCRRIRASGSQHFLNTIHHDATTERPKH